MPEVKIYTTPPCVYCKMAKAYFKENSIEYKEVDVASDLKARQEMIEKSGQMGVPVIDIDPQLADETTAEQLFVVCELAKEKCDPTHSPKAEVANFGWSKIEEEWDISGVTLYQLVHTE